MLELSERQKKILKAIIEEYIETGEPVGSETLEKKFSLGICPATIRNEMVKLVDMKYLRQPYTSAGRAPTALGFKYYIDSLMEEKKMSVAEEVAARESVWDYRFQFDRLLHELTRALAQQTRTLAISMTAEGDIYSAGYANVLDMPEFFDIDVTRNVLALVDEVKKLETLFEKAFGEDPIHIILGEELEQDSLRPCGFVFTHFNTGNDKSGTLGIIGPSRLNYAKVIPIIRYYGGLLQELQRNW